MADTIVQNLAWDSEFFNLKIGELNSNANQTDFLPESDSYDLLYVKTNVDRTIAIAGYNQEFSETKVLFGKQLSLHDKKSEVIFSDLDCIFDLDTIYELAFESGKHSRFKRDHNFEPLHFKNLYKIWVDNSINRKFADEVLLYIEKSDVLGFVTYKKHEQSATIGLIAVSPEAQGKGIGSQLIAETERRLSLEGIAELLIPTQVDNDAACSFYKKQGYKIVETTYIKHFWKSKRSTSK